MDPQRTGRGVASGANSNGAAASRDDSHAHDHFVQFYESDVFLIGSIARFIVPGLKDGHDSAIIAATPEHLDALERSIEKAGCDVPRLIEEGRYVAIDADELLSRFILDGRPDPMLFTEVVGGMVARSAASGRRLREIAQLQHHVVSEEGRIRAHEEALRRRQAFELNDAVIQGLTVAKLALELGETEKAAGAVAETITRARGLLSSLFGSDGAGGPLKPEDIRPASEATEA
ncbi:MAG: MEDS domain-containing protein [Actinomycetota bacterium]